MARRGSFGRLRASLALVAALAGASAQEEWFPVTCNQDCGGRDTCAELDVCVGNEVQTTNCPNNPRCSDEDKQCEPVSCIWHEWGEWSSDGVSGLCTRTRNFTPNRCSGLECQGYSKESKYCEPVPEHEARDCEFDAWNDWGECSDTTLQRSRQRSVKTPAVHGGAPCKGPLFVTEPCGERHAPVDCELDEWMEWSGCTKTCDGGQQIRLRGIVQAQHGGRLCGQGSASAVLQEMRSCNAKVSCHGDYQGQDCELSTWGPWSECKEEDKQRSRDREVLLPGSNGGAACTGGLSEVAACEAEPKVVVKLEPEDCKLSEWSQWSLCSKTCRGGQTYRRRFMEVPAAHGGLPCEDELEETMACNDFTCNLDPDSGDCLLSMWSEWAECSTTCGQGIEERTRSILVLPDVGGLFCHDPLDEVRPCRETVKCDTTDCEWGQWTQWSTCSKTCDGGERRRERLVVSAPTKGGDACSAQESTLEIEGCNTAQCTEQDCTDGKWGDWADWSDCTKSCDGGLSWRHRQVALPASPCGNPPEGEAGEVRKCNAEQCADDVDCVLKEWTEWSACSASCQGTRQRQRDIVPGARAGKWCTDGDAEGVELVVVEGCNGPRDAVEEGGEALAQACGYGDQPVQDCTLTDWEDWSACSATCDGGERKRSRTIAQEARFGGQPCEDSTQEVGPCAQNQCIAPEDCLWGDWSAWGDCTKCNGEKSRTRQIERQGNIKGMECEARSAMEVVQCDECAPVEVHYCVWGLWQEEPCSATCGTGAHHKLTRTLTKVPDEPADAALIVGIVRGADAECPPLSEVNFTTCSDQPKCPQDICTPQDCEMTEWTEWEEMDGFDSGPACDGICSRSREITKNSNLCGQACEGSTIETKVCMLPFEKSGCSGDNACLLSGWSEWSECAEGQGQRSRSRSIVEQAGQSGEVCADALKQTAPCPDVSGLKEPAEDCEFGEWNGWGLCSKTCGVGQQEMVRQVLTSARGGGSACTGPLRKIQPCGTDDCTTDENVDCALEDWGPWTGCSDANTQAHRKRTVRPALGNGQPCSGPVLESGPCPKKEPVDCKWTEWADWGICPVTCGGAQQFRTREVAQEAKLGGKLCEGLPAETQSCGEVPCSQLDCQVTDWEEWSGCQPACGAGQQQRQREILQAAEPQGSGCFTALSETRGCESALCNDQQDCEWGQWSEWGNCSKAEFCGTGYRTRSREITKPPSGMNAALCEALPSEEVVPSASCPGSCDELSCVDGEWGSWGEWSQCSVTCGGGGSRVRAREQVVEPDSCGNPVEGDVEEYQECHALAPCEPAEVTPQDCEFGEWHNYDPPECPQTCNGGQTRTRTIVRYSEHGGKPCEGSVKEALRCNPGVGQADPPDCTSGIAVDCKLSDWAKWSTCDAECGTGHSTRGRQVLVSPAFGGKDCNRSLEEIRTCFAEKDCVDNSMNCTFADWKEWGACEEATGQRLRTREVAQHKVGRGMDCQGPVKQVAKCSYSCVDKQYACQWGTWTMWSACDTTCGKQGRRKRERTLRISYEVQDGELVTSNAEVQGGGLATSNAEVPVQAKATNSFTDGGADQAWAVAATQQKYATAREKLLDVSVRRHADLATAFVAGMVTLALGFGMVRCGMRARRLRHHDLEAIEARAARVEPLATA